MKKIGSKLAKKVIGHTIEGYMDYVDFMYESGQPMHGNAFFDSVEKLRAQKRCVNHCGIVKVKITLVEWEKLPTGMMAFKDTPEYTKALKRMKKQRLKE